MLEEKLDRLIIAIEKLTATMESRQNAAVSDVKYQPVTAIKEPAETPPKKSGTKLKVAKEQPSEITKDDLQAYCLACVRAESGDSHGAFKKRLMVLLKKRRITTLKQLPDDKAATEIYLELRGTE